MTSRVVTARVVAPRARFSSLFSWVSLARFGNFVACTQAARADIDVLHRAINEQAFVLDIHDKASVGMTF